ncbi:pre-mRNA splicing factor SR-like 1 isoform X2 [Selaginella moellendorffii]|uniref:pre-mRNA splicing factor SR-like 1 isoform X2 n=1 Tax=Selaginella moellendorffii TaxID=88036 RepID=UPI000D1D03FA|nr:pre-mRNA splicing factor SR-like 1 isoform X2 [Selaginella moellendorffii]|eukprot:XP_024525960.1 pre-mRNA splicing factor SR-like 1 isoform X2 [Selaginella moellendorffii]
MSAEVQTCGKPIQTLVEHVVNVNILSSEYFKELYRLKTFHEVVDEIYNHVDHVEPWMTGNCRGPSTAFCLLYKFFTMKLTVKQMQGLLNHADSPYIRAIGFLYLRYCGEPRTLWQWFEPYIEDDEEFSPGTNGRVTKMGVYIRDLLLHQVSLFFLLISRMYMGAYSLSCIQVVRCRSKICYAFLMLEGTCRDEGRYHL